MAYTPVTTAHAGTQAAINGLLGQMGLAPAQGRMPRVEPLQALTEMPSVRRVAPLQATRLPVYGPAMPPMPQSTGPVSSLGGMSIPRNAPAGVNPASFVDDLAVAATGVGSKAGIAGRVGKAVVNPSATGLMKFVKPGIGVMGAVRPMLGYGMMGMAGSQVAGMLPGDSNVEQALQGAAMGAGIGAGVGSIVPGLGTGLGALVGGGIGGAAGLLENIFGGDDKGGGKLTEKVTNYLTSVGADADQQGSIMSLYELEKDALGDDVAKNNLMSRVAAFEQEQTVARQQEQEGALAQQRMLASQALAGQFFAPFAQQMVQSAQQRHEMMQNILPTLPENFRGIAAAQSAAALDNATRMATAYQAQAQMIPAMASFQQQQDQVNSLASQLLQQGIQQTLQPQQGTDLMSLLQGG